MTSQRSRPCLYVELDLLADEPAQQHVQIGEHLAELQHLRTQRLTPREGQQLTHEAGGAVGVLLDLHDVVEGRIGRPMVGEQKIGEADDRRQHIVEIVRDAAGKLAYGLHLLRSARNSSCSARCSVVSSA